MVEVTESTLEELNGIAESKGKDEEYVIEKFKENYEEAEEQTNYSGERLESFAVRITRSDITSEARIPANEVLIKTIGMSRIFNWDQRDENGNVKRDGSGEPLTKDVLVAFGLVDQNPNEDKGREQVATVFFDETDDVSLTEAQEAFSEMGNLVTGEFSVSDGDLEKYLNVNTVESTDFDVEEPDDREEVLSDIRGAIQETTIEDIADNLSATERNSQTGEEFAVGFGVDMRVLEGDIVDAFARDNGDSRFGIYTVRDETMFDDEDIIGSDVQPTLDDENQTPGLTCWVDPDQMEYGSGSVCEFYGSVTQGDDGQVTMNIFGINPIFEREFDGYVDDGSEEDGYDNDDEEVETNSEVQTI